MQKAPYGLPDNEEALLEQLQTEDGDGFDRSGYGL